MARSVFTLTATAATATLLLLAAASIASAQVPFCIETAYTKCVNQSQFVASSPYLLHLNNSCQAFFGNSWKGACVTNTTASFAAITSYQGAGCTTLDPLNPTVYVPQGLCMPRGLFLAQGDLCWCDPTAFNSHVVQKTAFSQTACAPPAKAAPASVPRCAPMLGTTMYEAYMCDGSGLIVNLQFCSTADCSDCSTATIYHDSVCVNPTTFPYTLTCLNLNGGSSSGGASGGGSPSGRSSAASTLTAGVAFWLAVLLTMWIVVSKK